MLKPQTILLLIVATSVFLSGCLVTHPPCVPDCDLDHYRTVAMNSMPDEAHAESPPGHAPLSTDAPLVIDANSPPPTWEMSLEEAIRLGLENARVLRDLGGSVLRTPSVAQTVHDPAIQATDPRFGMEGALAAFDAQLATKLIAQKNDRAFNNLFLGGGAFLFRQDLDNFDTELSKVTATGASFAVRHHIDYDANNAPANVFPSAWNTNYETEFRQPLLQGGGVEFNRIAGPKAVPWLMNGVVIARINADASTAEFEIGLRDFISNVENAYWDLYYAYRELDAKIAARDAALRTWRIIHANVEAQRGYSKLQEVQALEQYYRFQEDVLDALGGRLIERTRTNNGSNGGTFRGVGGVHAAERRLRMWMGLPINDGKLIRPSDEPPQAKVVFDWDQITQEALATRPELHRQRAQVQRASAELIASKNFLLPKLDVLGRYRWRGFGHGWMGDFDPASPFDNALSNLTTGRFQEWELGFEYSMPLGFRREYATVRNAQLRVAREKAILEEQERQAVHDLADAYSDVPRGYALMQVAQNRAAAAQDQYQRAYDSFFELGGKVSLELVLDARIRLAEAETDYHRARIDYALAIKNVHFEKGSLLEYNGAVLADRLHHSHGGDDHPEFHVSSDESARINYRLSVRRSQLDEGEENVVSDGRNLAAPLATAPTPAVLPPAEPSQLPAATASDADLLRAPTGSAVEISDPGPEATASPEGTPPTTVPVPPEPMMAPIVAGDRAPSRN
jgi:outer membrane protein TolC